MKIHKTRIAPTPSGYLHIGNVVNFLITATLARQSGAKILLRIDDLDQARKRPEYVQDVFDTLRFLDIPWDEGPRDAEDFEQHWSQHRRLPSYRAAFEHLQDKKLVFACHCSRKQVAMASRDGKYPGTCRQQPAPKKATCNWRFKVDAHAPAPIRRWEGVEENLALPAHLQDFVVWKKDGLPAYQLASLVDDLHFGVDFIVRGKDLLGSTAAQLLLAQALEEPRFGEIRFLHHELVYAEDNQKLSKSAGSTSIHYMRSIGLQAADVYRQVSQLLSLQREMESFGEFVETYRG